MILSFLISAAAGQQAEPPIVVTGAREPVAAEAAPTSSTVLEEAALDALDLSAAADLVRLAPGLSVAASGPRGTQVQVRIRGAEANHSLLFVDGIRFNDPAAGNEARFELLAADLLSRLEIVRGPQSALWGSEALGGVIAADGADPLGSRGGRLQGEYGSLDSHRLAGRYVLAGRDAGAALSAASLGSDGVDSFGDGGERDGFRHSAARLAAAWRPARGATVGAVGHWIEGRSAFDGFDPLTFRRADTGDETRNRIAALRGWARTEHGSWTFAADASLLSSRNRNFLDDAPLNRTAGRRFAAGAQATGRFGGHSVTAAVQHEEEDFRARDQAFFGATDQDRSRRLTALVGQWRAEWTAFLVTDLAVRRDDFSAFADATALRAGLVLRPGGGIALHGAWGDGIAQPTFYDLYGFFPGSFAGNPDLKPERSRGWEAGIRWQRGRAALGAVYFRHRLTDEIVDVFDPATFLSSPVNAHGTSRRRGVELTAEFRLPSAALFAGYGWLDADERQVAGALLVREVRRPRHSASIAAFGETGRIGWSASLAWVGGRTDLDFDLFPAERVLLGAYALASARVAYALTGGVEAYARVENGFDADYQDVVGYHTAGRTVHAGLRLALGR